MSVNTTKLYKLAVLNNSHDINQIIIDNPKIDINKKMRGAPYILKKVIEVRAREVFDILIEMPGLNDPHLSCALDQALEYYMGSTNESDKYYANKIIQLNFNYMSGGNNFELLDSNDLIWNIVFNKINHSEDGLMSMMYRSLRKNNMQLLKSIDNYIQSNKQTFFRDFTEENFYKVLYSDAVSSNKIDFMLFLKNRVQDWRVFEGIPIIYWAVSNINHGEFITINYLIDQFAQMNKEELNAIPNIKSLEPLFEYDFYEFGEFFVEKYEVIKSILKLPINFDDCAQLVRKHILSTLKNYNYDLDDINGDLLLFYLLETKLIKSNIFEFDYSEFALKIQADVNNKKMYKNKYKYLKTLQFFAKYFNIKVSESFQKFFDTDPVENFDTEYEKFIKKLKKLYDNLVVEKPAKKATKSKAKNKEIDV